MKPMLAILPLVLGPVSTNCFLIADPDSGEAAVIDPAWDGGVILDEAAKHAWKIGQLWYTHAHFDHFGGAAVLAQALNPAPSIALHPADRPLWETGGGASAFGFTLNPGPVPSVDLSKSRLLSVGAYSFDVRHAPGHSPGSCIFYCAEAGVLFSGDLIFHHSVGRADLAGGDWEALEESIRTQVYPLPDGTRILSGHGEETSVGEEKRENPFVRP
jgi:hydroxyacylglutathione hydrolase